MERKTGYTVSVLNERKWFRSLTAAYGYMMKNRHLALPHEQKLLCHRCDEWVWVHDCKHTEE